MQTGNKETMLAYRFLGQEGLALGQVPRPSLNEGGAVLEILACSVCGTDLRTYRFGSAKIDPGRVVGHEMIGRITALAPEWETDFAVGNVVGIAPAIGCGACLSCQNGKPNMCDALKTIGFQYDGGFAEAVELPRQAFAMGNVYPLPPAEDYLPYALSEPLACVINAQSYLRPGRGDTVAVFGAGVIGCMHAELALASGAERVFILEPAEERLRQGRAILPGATWLNSAGGDAAEQLKAATGGQGVDVAVIACSVGAAQAQGLQALAKCGRISLFGGLPGEAAGFLDSNLIHYRELGVFGVHASTPAHNRAAMQMIQDGRVDARKYITTYPLHKAPQAMEDLAAGRILKAVLKPGDTGSEA